MTTILEIQKPHLTYCQKYEDHCLCPECKGRGEFCLSCTSCEKHYKILSPVFRYYRIGTRPVTKCQSHKK